MKLRNLMSLHFEVLARDSNHGPLEPLRRALPYQPNGSLIEYRDFVDLMVKLASFAKAKWDIPGIEPGPPGWKLTMLTTIPRYFC